MEGNDIRLAVQRCRNDFLEIFIAGLMIWPLAQCINFRFIPLRHRLIFNQSIALMWNTYLAWKTNQPKEVNTGS
uniref:Mitochondrial inner membrane protein Mpv17 n=1 Tax=Romanomermis culicivorax TaxID=13658 RepID=A0A915JG59_ROMCU